MESKDYLKHLIQKDEKGSYKIWSHLNLSYEDIVSAYEESDVSCPIMIKKARFTDGGWGNGYVRIPEGHEHYGKKYDDIDYNVHGGLTFSEIIPDNDSQAWPPGHWIGFDTAHSGDTPQNCSKDYVLSQTIYLLRQVHGV